ncbi:MAG: type III pantothenate kinase [Limisphaerales bacterium]|jgi:type III pantothenate kinase
MSAVSLILDFGNTRDKVAIFKSNKLNWRKTCAERLDLSGLRQICEEFKPEAAILSSTTEDRQELRDWLNKNLQFLLLTHETKVPFTNAYASPATLGRDRIALIAAARIHYPQGPVLVIDAGTCITYDLLDNQDVYHGGAIAPGIWMRLQAMHTFTAKLPLVSLQNHLEKSQDSMAKVALIGDSTVHSMQSGALHGAAAEIDGIIDRYRAEFEGLNILLTGGDHITLVSLLKNRIFATRDLVPEGLNKILAYNVQG